MNGGGIFQLYSGEVAFSGAPIIGKRLSALKNERKLKVKLRIQNKCRTNFFRD
jgi:hypothetical protein